MSLGLQLPWALLLGGLVVLPVIAHLTRQRPTDRVAYGAMMLLERLVKRLRRRRSSCSMSGRSTPIVGNRTCWKRPQLSSGDILTARP